MNWSNILSRAGWTFVETAAATFIGIEIVFTDSESVTSALIAAAIAGGSAVLSLLKTIATEQLSILKAGAVA